LFLGIKITLHNGEHGLHNLC